MARINLYFMLIVLSNVIYESRLAKYAVEVIPERAEISYLNSKYVVNATVNVRRSSRRGQYVTNLSGYIKQTWANNVSVFIYLHEYLHNEYRPSFVEASYKLCDFINKDPYGSLIQKYGIVCPLYKKFWVISNGTIAFPSFPSLFPFSKCEAEVIIKRMVPSEEIISKGALFLTIKQTYKKT